MFGEAEKVTKPSVSVYENKTEKEVIPVEIVEYNDMGLATVKKSGYENNYRVEETVYDSMGRAEAVKKYAVLNETPSSEVRTVSYTYDANGNIFTQTDEEGNVKTYTYTPRNQKETETDPMSSLITYVYDRNDKVI